MKKYTAKPSPATTPDSQEPVEIVDAHDRPLLVMPLAEAHRQALCHRVVLILLYDLEGRLYLQKRSRSKRLYPGRWDLSATGHVQAWESREGAAIRELREELGLSMDRLKYWQEVPAGPDNNFENVTLFSAGRRPEQPEPNPVEVMEGCYVDRDELSFLVREFRDTLTPALVYFWDKGLIFPSDLVP